MSKIACSALVLLGFASGARAADAGFRIIPPPGVISPGTGDSLVTIEHDGEGPIVMAYWDTCLRKVYEETVTLKASPHSHSLKAFAKHLMDNKKASSGAYYLSATAPDGAVLLDPFKGFRGERIAPVLDATKLSDRSVEFTYELGQDALARELVMVRHTRQILAILSDWSFRRKGSNSTRWDLSLSPGLSYWGPPESLVLAVTAHAIPSPRLDLVFDGAPRLTSLDCDEKPGRELDRHAFDSVLNPYSNPPNRNHGIRCALRQLKDFQGCPLDHACLEFDIDGRDRWVISQERFELMVYQDGVFMYESEIGHAPYRIDIRRDGSRLPSVISVELRGYYGNFGTAHVAIN